MTRTRKGHKEGCLCAVCICLRGERTIYDNRKHKSNCSCFVCKPNRKNRTYEQIYGVDRAKELKSQLAIAHKDQKGWSKGLTAETNVSLAKNAEKRGGKTRTDEQHKHMKAGVQRAKQAGRGPWFNPAITSKMRSVRKNNAKKRGNYFTPTGLSIISESSKRLLGRKRPKHECEAVSKGGKKVWSNYTTSQRKVRSSKLLAVWSKYSETERSDRIKKVLASTQATPNKFEFKCMEHLNRLFPGKFKYTGDGSFMVGGHSADAYSEELNTVALFHGVYWHLRKKGLEINEDNKRTVSANDACPFIFAGCKVIIIWEDELNNLLKRNRG
jgi:hypothetical protein